jgi:hypothetical protein
MPEPSINTVLKKLLPPPYDWICYGNTIEENFNTLKYVVDSGPNEKAIFGERENAPTWEEFKEEFDKQKAEYDSFQYGRNRKLDYPEIGDQLDALYHAGLFPKEMAAKLKAVKDKYPKSELPNGN